MDEVVELREWDSKVKNQIRSIICSNPGVAYKKVLLLPSDTCLDLIEMVNNGSIDPSSTSVVAVEKDPDIAKDIERRLKELKIKRRQVLNCELEKVKLEGVFDFIYLDTCGQLQAPLLNWLCTQVQLKHFSDNCQITVAISNYKQSGFRFYDKYKKFLKKEKKSPVSSKPVFVGANPSHAQDQQNRHMNMMLRSILGPCEKSWVYRNEGSPVSMHVFSYKVRPLNTGITQMLKFLSIYSDQELQIMSAGVKAAIKRTNCLHKKHKTTKVNVKAPKVQSSGHNEVLLGLIKDAQDMIRHNLGLIANLQLTFEKTNQRINDLEFWIESYKTKPIESVKYPLLSKYKGTKRAALAQQVLEYLQKQTNPVTIRDVATDLRLSYGNASHGLGLVKHQMVVGSKNGIGNGVCKTFILKEKANVEF